MLRKSQPNLSSIMLSKKTSNPTKKRKVLIEFDDTIADIESNKKSYSH